MRFGAAGFAVRWVRMSVSPAPTDGTAAVPTPLDVATLPLSDRAATLLAYSAGWLSGWLVLTLEGRRAHVRVHAAQAFIGFGLLALLSGTLLVLAGASLFVSVGLFRALLWATQAVIVVGVVLWVAAMVQAARGVDWRWPVVGKWAEGWINA
jgi:uncharacterized membrane protein